MEEKKTGGLRSGQDRCRYVSFKVKVKRRGNQIKHMAAVTRDLELERDLRRH